jgi:hypothetical protein
MPSLLGMCAELQEAFNMSTNETALPFPLKKGMSQSHEQEEPLPDIEATRRARLSEVRI